MEYNRRQGGFFVIMNTLNISILKPGGNDTALIQKIPKKSLRKSINDAVMKTFPNVEQVGFYTYDKPKKLGVLEMAGGEFCGNATRSLAYLLLDGKKGKLTIKASGTQQLLNAGVNKPSTAFAQMPIKKDLSAITQLEKNTWKVSLDGITHLITPKPKNVAVSKLKTLAKRLLGQYDLLSSVPAAGIMFLNEKEQQLTISPVVWVRDIETLFYETACASGTTAVGLYLAKYKGIANRPIPILQPSGSYINVQIRKTNKSFLDAYIDGPIESIGNKKISIKL
jgi:histidine racemase